MLGYITIEEVYKRWVELATFAPVHRFHYANWANNNDNGHGNEAYVEIGKEPWNYGCEDISRTQINMRYELIPYLYSCTADSVIGTGMEGDGAKGTGIPLARPMVMEYYNDASTYDMDTQFMCGPSFLVAPVVEDSDKKQVYFPEGSWYDYSDGTALNAAESLEALEQADQGYYLDNTSHICYVKVSDDAAAHTVTVK